MRWGCVVADRLVVFLRACMSTVVLCEWTDLVGVVRPVVLVVVNEGRQLDCSVSSAVSLGLFFFGVGL